MKNFIAASRPKTLVAAIIPPVVAHALFMDLTGKPSYFVMALCLSVALLLQLATNFYNDAIDFKKGADQNRIGPKRVVAAGSSAFKTVMLWGHVSLFLTFLVAIPLILKGGLPILLLGLLSAFLAYGYTGGPYPLAYKGLGELFVFIFFGLVAVVGCYYLMSLQTPMGAWILGSQIGLLSCVLIAVNNFRDKDEDIKVSKLTLATKLSRNQYLMLMDAFLFLPYFLNLYFFFMFKSSYIFVILAMPVAHKVRSIMHQHNNPSELNEALKFGGIHLLLFGILFVMGSLWQH
jgi:1,4-dihydroxy-2-naphthoate octaprenyltransferase